MPEEVLWERDEHTAAKHRVLRAYLDAWVPVMGFQALKAPFRIGEPRLLLVDGFAGPGRYKDGEEGSPLIMIDAIVSHAQAARLMGVKYLLYFIEHDSRRVEYLNGELAKLALPENLVVEVVPGEFEDEMGELVSGVVDHGRVLVPTFAFIDPFGYSAASMTLTGKILDFPRSEALFFVPLSYIHRFVGRAGQENALDSLFGTDRWREAIPLLGQERRQFLIDLFESQLRAQGNVRHVRAFELHTADGQDYRLVFATGHDKGLDLMKDAMWSVDPAEGQRFVARTQTGQEVLFTPGGEVDTTPLLEELRAAFGTSWFTSDDAEKVTLVSPFKASHLRTRTLRPAETDGTLEVDRSGGGRQFAATGVRMRFRDG